MSRKILFIAGSVIALLLILVGAAYMYFNAPVAAPSSSITEIGNTLSSRAEVETATSSGSEMFSQFQIDSTQSSATFKIFEVLRGEDFTVVGTTDQVAGTILVNENNVTLSSASEILVNARTLKTDSTNRDGAIARMILKSENAENEFIRFLPKSIDGLPENGVIGTAYPLRIAGDLTISGTTNPVLFDATVVYTPEKTLSLTAKTSIQRSDFNLVVPDLPFLADVSETVEIELSLLALPQA